MLTQMKLLLAAAVLCGVSATQAQNENSALVEKSPVVTAVVKVQNVAAPLVLQWLQSPAPDSNPKAGTSLSSSSQMVPGKGQFPKAPFPVVLPAGIQRLTADAEQNSLLISGPAETVQQTQELIKRLDQPLRQFEIECQIVAVDKAALGAAGFQFQQIGQDGKFQQAVLRPSFHALLNSWVQNRQGVIFSSPRVVTFEGSSATITSHQQISNLQISVADGQKSVVAYDTKLHKAVEAPYLANQWSVSALPTAHNNGTATVELGIQHKQLLAFRKSLPVGTAYGPPNETNSHVLQNLDDFKGTLTFTPADTVALTGFTTATNVEFQQNEQRTLQGKQIVIFVTVREVRRLPKPVPST